MKFNLEINLDNDAMSRPSNIANALTTLADEIFHYTAGDPFEKIRMNAGTVINGRVRDDNGNTVGSWSVTTPKGASAPRYDWTDFEPDDADNIPDKYILTIRDDEEELAVIVHRTLGGTFPLNGRLAEDKRVAAQQIVDALTHDMNARRI